MSLLDFVGLCRPCRPHDRQNLIFQTKGCLTKKTLNKSLSGLVSSTKYICFHDVREIARGRADKGRQGRQGALS